MKKKKEKSSDAAPIQVFELTMDNPEDQDELNRRLQKPAETNHVASKMTKHKMEGQSTTEKKSRSRDSGSS